MKLVLRDGAREIVFFSRQRVLRFDDLEAAADYLDGWLREGSNLAALRSALAQSEEHAWLARLPYESVVARVSRAIMTGTLHLLPDMGLARWAFPMPPTPSHPDMSGGAESLFDRPLVPDDGGEGEEEAPIDAVPEAVIPPEYPALAEREGDAMVSEALAMGLEIDTLRFRDGPSTTDSEIAVSMREVARRSGMRLDTVTRSVGDRLGAMGLGGPPDQPDSQVAFEFKSIIGPQATQLTSVAGQVGVSLEVLSRTDIPAAPTTKVGQAMRDLVGPQSGRLERSAVSLAVRLGPIASDVVRAPSTETAVGAVYTTVAKQHGRQLERATANLGDRLDRWLVSGAP